MLSYNKFNSLSDEVAKGGHDLSVAQIKVAFTAVAPVSTNAVLADLTEIDYANCSSRDVVTISSGQTAGDYKLDLTDLEIVATGGDIATFRYIVLYDDTSATKKLLGFYDYIDDITIKENDKMTVDFDNIDGALTISQV